MNKPNLNQHLRRTFFALAIVGALLALPKAEATITEVVGGLHRPRGLAFVPGGPLFVAQTGDDTVAGSIIEIPTPMAIRPIVRTIVTGPPVIRDPAAAAFLALSGISLSANGP